MAEENTSTWRSKRWIFVMNNPGEWRPPSGSDVGYMIYQLERGEQGTTHIQGYIRFNKIMRFNAVKRWFSTDAIHLEKAQGNEAQNKAYCSKNESRVDGPWEFGDFSPKEGTQGKRTDLEDIADKVVKGATAKEIAQEHPGDFIRYHQGIYALIQEVQPLPPMEREVQVIVLWGPTGTGKTHRIRHACPDIYDVKPGRDPWGSYSGQAAIFFDEFDWSKWSIQDMNRYLDKWRCLLDARYRDRYAAWTRVAICANSDPMTWWPDERSRPLIDAFRRRIPNVVEVLSKEQVIDW